MSGLPPDTSAMVQAVLQALGFEHNDALVGQQTNIDFEDGGGVTWTLTLDAANDRVKISASVPAAAVASVFGRTGAIAAEAGDYTAAMVTNAADKSSPADQDFTGNVVSGTLKTWNLFPAAGTLKIGGGPTDELGFYGETPIAQPSAIGGSAGYVPGSVAGTFHENDQYSGDVGSTYYTINGIVAAMKNLGLIAP